MVVTLALFFLGKPVVFIVLQSFNADMELAEFLELDDLEEDDVEDAENEENQKDAKKEDKVFELSNFERMNIYGNRLLTMYYCAVVLEGQQEVLVPPPDQV